MLFDRVAELTVGASGGKGILIKDLHFSFSIEKTLSETLNNSTVRIFNLNRDSRKLVETPNNVVILRAGYVEDVGPVTCFVGIVRRSLTVREGVDWVTELELDDGLLAYRDAKFSLSFAPGVSGGKVLNAVAKHFNLPVRPLPAGISSKTYPQGFAFVGRTREAMNTVCNYLDLEWSIQDQEIQVLKKGGVKKNQAILISSESGMIGSPAAEAKTLSDKAAAKQGITTDLKGVIKRLKEVDGGDTETRLEVQGFKVKTLLQPASQPGDIVKLKAEGIDDFLKVEKLTHTGDNLGGEWQTEYTLRFI